MESKTRRAEGGCARGGRRGEGAARGGGQVLPAACTMVTRAAREGAGGEEGRAERWWWESARGRFRRSPQVSLQV